MDSAHENLLARFEEFELDLEVKEILKKVKQEWVWENESLGEFAETLKQLEPEKVEAQRRRAEQAAPFHQLCYPQVTCDWSSRAWTIAAPIGGTNLNVPSRPHQHRGPLLMPRIKRIKRPARRPPPNDDSPDELTTTMDTTSDDSEDSPDELAQLRAKEDQRRARRRVVNARYRARHPERVAAQRQSYRARHPERVAAQKRRYRVNHPEREAARKRRYRAKKRKDLSLTDDDDDDEMAERQTCQPRYRTRYGNRIARGLAERQRTQEKRQALGPLSLTIRVDDFMQGFWDSLSPGQEVIIMDRASGAPLDSSCDLWDEGKGFLDNLLQESTDVPSDDSLQDVFHDLGPWSPQECDFDLEDFVS